MIWTVDNTMGAGRKVVRVTDANGFDYPQTTHQFVTIDDQTGKCVIAKLDATGRKVINHLKGVMETEEVRLAPPVLVQFAQIQDEPPEDPARV